MIPILYESQHLSIQTQWVFVVIALLFSSYLAVRRLKRQRVNFTLLIQHNGLFLLSALFFSRLVFFFFNTDAYFPRFDWRTLWNFLSIWDQGLSLWGAVLGFFVALSYRLWKEQEEMLKWADALFVPMLIGIMIGGIGSFLGGYAYGTPTKLPWGVRYEIANVRYTVPIHPTQIYLILLVGLLLWSKRELRKRTEFFSKEGNGSLYLINGFSLIYFILEFLRGDVTLLIWKLRIGHYLSALVFLISITFLIKRYRAYKNPQDHESIPST
jgi:phosphatidylglycerol:prolipoprotein diacylglycerol transferase